MALVLMIDKVSLWAFRLSSILTMILVMITAEQVFARYFFQASSIGLQELEWHLFGCLFLMAGAHTYKIGGHVRVDIVQRLLSPILQTWVERMGILFFLLPCCAVLMSFGVDFALQARDFSGANEIADGTWLSWLLLGESSSDPGGLKARWLIRAVIPLSAGLLFLQGISEFIKSFIRKPNHAAEV